MEEMSVTAAADLLGKTDRTIRNYIKEGRIKAKRIENQFGWEYQIYDLGEFSQEKVNIENQSTIEPETKAAQQPETKAETALDIISQENKRLWEEYNKLREANNRLAYDLGVRDQHIKELEQALETVKLLTSPATDNLQKNMPAPSSPSPRPWWKRLFRR